MTPLAATSAIGRYSRLVLPYLKEWLDVEAFAFGPDEQGVGRDVPVRVFETRSQAAASLDDFDIAVYQIGNYWPFHGEIMLTAWDRPGIVVLHDQSLQHLMAGYCFEQLRDPDAYVSLMRDSHGPVAAEQALAAQSGLRPPVWETEDAIAYPLTPVMVRNALGVVSHSEFGIRAVRPSYAGPAAVLPLPLATPAAGGVVPREKLGVSADALLVITTGHLNPNKRPDEVIRALGRLPEDLRSRVVYALLGPVAPWYAAKLCDEARKAGMADRIRIEAGYVEDSRLHAYIAHADLCVNLRYPNYEAASGSLIEQLLAGKAVVASSTGFFAELPDNVVWRVSTADELAEALRTLLSNRGLREELAARGVRFARHTFRADRYAASLSTFLGRAVRMAPVLSLERALQAHAQELGFAPSDPWTQSLRQRVRNLFLSDEGEAPAE